jgi:hypothetical protein
MRKGIRYLSTLWLWPIDLLYQIRITSQDFYGVGSLWIIDLTHLPYGCSVHAYPVELFKEMNHWVDTGVASILEQRAILAT